jgi:hypothetical protein
MVSNPARIHRADLLRAVGVLAVSVSLVLGAAITVPAAPARASESVSGMFRVLRTSAPVALPATPARTLARLKSTSKGRRARLDVAQTRRIGRPIFAIYLIPGTHGICAVHGNYGACSANLNALSVHGLRFWVLHPRDRRTGNTPVDIYGALPDGLPTISAQPLDNPTLIGTNAHNNGYGLHLADDRLRAMYLTGPRGAAILGPLTDPGRSSSRRTSSCAGAWCSQRGPPGSIPRPA